MSKVLILEDYNDNECQQNSETQCKLKKKPSHPCEPSRKTIILTNILLSTFLFFGLAENGIAQWGVLAPINLNNTRLSPEVTIFYIAKDVAQLIATPFVGAIIDKIGPDIPYICGGVIMFASTVALRFWERPVCYFFVRIFHGLGSAFTDISTLVIIANMFTTSIMRSICMGMVIIGGSMTLYLLVRYMTMAVLLTIASIIFINSVAVYKTLSKLKAEKAKEFQITKAAPIPIWKLLIDPYIMICVGALIISNIPLVFFLKTVHFHETNRFLNLNFFSEDTAFIMFISHSLGLGSDLEIASRFPSYRWLIALTGLTLEGLSCYTIVFIDSNICLELLASFVAYGVGMVTAAILPTFARIMDLRYAPVFGSVYALANASYSIAFIISPLIAYLNLSSLGFTTIAVSMGLLNTLYAPILVFLRGF